MNYEALRNEYERRLKVWQDAETAYELGGTDQQRRDMIKAEIKHDVIAKLLVRAGYSL
jgi:hypothetical protein